MNDHRGQLRYPMTGRGQFTAGTPPVSLGVRLRDISEAGISFLSDVAIAAGARGQVSFSVHTGGENLAAALDVQVQTCVLERHAHRVGAVFVDTGGAAGEQIARVVAARAAVVKGR